MFKSRRISVDAVGSRSERRIVSGGSSGPSQSVRVRSGQANNGPRHPVPEEYKTLERARGGGWGIILFLVLLFAATVAGLYYWNMRPTSFQGDSITMTVSADKELVSGDVVTYEVNYTNVDTVALKTVELDVQWPDGFYYNDASEKPTSETATTWNLGPMNSGETRQLTISGQLVGLKSQTQVAIFRISYRPENINSDYEVKKVAETVISDSQIDVSLATADKIIAGQDVDFSAEISNLTGGPLDGITVEIVVPKDFDITSSNPKLTDNTWIGTIKQDTPLAIELKAHVADDADGEQSWVVEVSTTANEQVRKLMRKELRVTPVRPNFDISLKINGQSDNFDIGYGETLNYQLSVTNKSASPLPDIKVTALMDSDVIDRATVQSNGVAEKDSIVWTRNNIDKLATMQPNEELLISWQAKLLPQGTLGQATVDTIVTLEIEGLPGWHQTSPVFVVTVGQGLVFSQGAYWNLGGQKVGSGNLPPVTNERTLYVVVWSLDSGSQDFDTVTMSTTLPPKVTYVSTGSVDEGTLKYDADTNRLEWQINNFSSKLLPLKATFTIKLVPLDEDKGTVMPILNPATIDATGKQVFQSKSYSVTTAQVVTTQTGDFGTVIE